MREGIVVRIDSRYAQVESAGQTLQCPVRGRLFRETRGTVKPIAVGDRVAFDEDERGDTVVESVLPRRNKLSRRSVEKSQVEQVIVANVDQLLIVASVKRPKLNLGLVDRLLVAAENGELEAAVCVNKTDLARDEQYCERLAVYAGLGYGAVATSAVSGAGLPELVEILKGKTTVLAGPSGCGKSSLLMAIQPRLNLRVREISEATSKGKHTTSSVSLLGLDFGGYVVDTPGVREFSIWDVSRRELGELFPEVFARWGQCRYSTCSHSHEPQCVVRAAVESGEIDEERYQSYLRILDSLAE